MQLPIDRDGILRMQIGKAADGNATHDTITAGKRLIIRGGMEVEIIDGYADPENEAEFDQFRFLSVGRRVGKPVSGRP